MAESFVSTLRDDLVSGLEFPSRQAAKTAMFDYLETFYNTRQLHSALGYRSPADFEEDRMEEPRVAEGGHGEAADRRRADKVGRSFSPYTSKVATLAGA